MTLSVRSYRARSGFIWRRISEKPQNLVENNKNCGIITEKAMKELFPIVGKRIECGAFKDALGEIFDFVRAANKFFDTEQPWVTRSTDESACKNTLYQYVQIIANLAVLLYPFLPFSSEKICRWMGIENKWDKQSVPAGYALPKAEILFQRIDKKVIETETEKLRVSQ